MTTSTRFWTEHEEKIRKATRKYLPLYERVCARHQRMVLPENFSSRVEMALPNYVSILPYHAGGRSNMFNGLMPVLALMAAVHTTLRDSGWTVDQIGRLTYEVFYEHYAGQPALARRVMRNVMVSPLFSRFMRRACDAMERSDRPDTFEIQYSYNRTPVPTTTMNCTRCGMIAFMRRAELTEMYSYCNIFDFAQADAIELGLVQPECIGRGDARCTYHFTRDSSQTRYPQSVRRVLSTGMEM